MSESRPLQTPFAVNLTIAEAWQEKDRLKINQVVTKYRLVDERGVTIGIFTTPSGSRLSEIIFKIGKREKLGR